MPDEHSSSLGSSVADIRVTRSCDDVRIEIRDEGRGIPAEKLFQINLSNSPGVGLRGIRERLRQLGGSLEVSCRSGAKGLVVIARLPITEGDPATESSTETECIDSPSSVKRHTAGVS